MTKALYLKDSYLKEWEAKVESVGGDGDKKGKFIILDKTAFYPKSGGQPWDEGVIVTEDENEYNVVFVGKFNGEISHEVASSGLKEGDIVRCKLDWERRYKLMRSHTAAHIVSEVIHNKTEALITGNQLGVEKSRIDFSLDDFDKEELKSYESNCNEIVNRGLPISYEFKSREEVVSDPEMTKLAKGVESLPKSVKNLRILKIGDFDIQADGGTHVKNTREVGKIEFINFKNKGKDNRRIYFNLSDGNL